MSDSSSLAHALALHRSGDLAAAESIYLGILRLQPGHADALHLLGMLEHARGNATEAERLIRNAIAVQPNQPVFHGNLGLLLAAAGKLSDAVQAHRLALSLDPSSAQTLNNLGVALHLMAETDEAMDCFKRAVVLQPEYADARANLLQLLNHAPQSAAAEHAIGDVLHDAGRDVDAIICYRRAISLDADFAPSHNNLANLLSDAGQLAEAIPAYLRALNLQPNSADLLSNLGNALRAAGQREPAMECYARALSLRPDHVKTHNNVGNALCEMGQWSAAVESYERALAIDPNFAETLNNLGTALEEQGHRDRAMALYQRALQLSPNSISAPWNIALLQLLRGDYENGWPGYEHRWRQKKQCLSFRNFPQPLLSLELLRPGMKVLLHAEQGFGDAIQFCRYAGRVAALDAEVIVECPPPLVRLFTTLRGVARIIPHGTPLPEFDLQCPFMSLPMVFSSRLEDVGAFVPYLAPDPNDVANWEKRFTDEPQAMRVGLVWAGSGKHQKDRDRSLNLSAFSGLTDISGVRLYSLQLGEKCTQAKSPPAGMQLIDWTAHLRDFADTAAMISQLDLVIAVDTAVAHLAGAMGKPVWILIPFQPDWRWLLDRTDSPWYASARLFRQTAPGQWDQPLAEFAQVLKEVCL
jgi:tetratricopeptide (TPR) repeat protein